MLPIKVAHGVMFKSPGKSVIIPALSYLKLNVPERVPAVNVATNVPSGCMFIAENAPPSEVRTANGLRLEPSITTEALLETLKVEGVMLVILSLPDVRISTALPLFNNNCRYFLYAASAKSAVE